MSVLTKLHKDFSQKSSDYCHVKSFPDPQDLPFLMEQLRPLSNSWKFLGLLLRLTVGELNEIESMPMLIPGGPAVFLEEMLNRWLKQAPPFHPFPINPHEVCDALRSCTVGECRVAYDLQQQYWAQRTGLSVYRSQDSMNTFKIS